MDREEALKKAYDAKELSQQGLQLIQQGKYREGHNLMRQAYLLLVGNAGSFSPNQKSNGV